MKITLKPQGNALIAHCDGPLDEDSGAEWSRVAALFGKANSPATLTLQLGTITSINSLGFRAYSRFLGQIASTAQIELAELTPEMIDYCNLLPALARAKRCVSLQVPYLCDSCNAKQKVVYSVRDVSPHKPFATKPCGGCGGTAKAEIAAGEYLEFLLT